MLDTKTSQAISFFTKGDYKRAFAIFKTFKIGFSKDENRTIEIAYESICSRSSRKFYESIGIDVDLCIEKSKDMIISKYCLKR